MLSTFIHKCVRGVHEVFVCIYFFLMLQSNMFSSCNVCWPSFLVPIWRSVCLFDSSTKFPLYIFVLIVGMYQNLLIQSSLVGGHLISIVKLSFIKIMQIDVPQYDEWWWSFSTPFSDNTIIFARLKNYLMILICISVILSLSIFSYIWPIISLFFKTAFSHILCFCAGHLVVIVFKTLCVLQVC